jgi:hypothetical protein
MIPYDDLVAALSAWRARQGLPVSTLGGGGSGPNAAVAQPGSGPNAMTGQPGSGPYGQPGSGRTKAPSMPPPMHGQTHDDALEVGDEAMLEEHYESEGDDFAMSFAAGQGGDGDDATSIGGAPERPTEAEMNSRNDRDDW